MLRGRLFCQATACVARVMVKTSLGVLVVPSVALRVVLDAHRLGIDDDAEIAVVVSSKFWSVRVLSIW